MSSVYLIPTLPGLFIVPIYLPWKRFPIPRKLGYVLNRLSLCVRDSGWSRRSAVVDIRGNFSPNCERQTDGAFLEWFRGGTGLQGAGTALWFESETSPSPSGREFATHPGYFACLWKQLMMNAKEHLLCSIILNFPPTHRYLKVTAFDSAQLVCSYVVMVQT